MNMKQCILAGAGHAQLFVLEALLKTHSGFSDVHFTLVCPDRYQYYSGMIPGWLAGCYDIDSCRIDIVPIIKQLKEHDIAIDWIQDVVLDVDVKNQHVITQHSVLDFDFLSINVGSRSKFFSGIEGARFRETYEDVNDCKSSNEIDVLSIKPIDEFCGRVISKGYLNNKTSKVAVFGSGAAAVELAGALAQHREGRPVTLVVKNELLPGFPLIVQKLAKRRLYDLGIALRLLTDECVRLDEYQWIINATGTMPINLKFTHDASSDQSSIGDDGFILVDSNHRMMAASNIFVAGDACSRPGSPLQRSGVHAVRSGPVLAENLLAAIQGAGTQEESTVDSRFRVFRPRKNNLYLISIGYKWAILSYGRLAVKGRLIWRLKDIIDRRFINRFTTPNR